MWVGLHRRELFPVDDVELLRPTRRLVRGDRNLRRWNPCSREGAGEAELYTLALTRRGVRGTTASALSLNELADTDSAAHYSLFLRLFFP